jgi:excinuclease ABC subunit C
LSSPERSGVYKMYDINHTLVYIGKAKNIKRRLQSYTKADVSIKTAVMLKSVVSIEFEVTQTETQALVLEASLIKKHQPKYNILLKDDKSRVYIKISNHAVPSIGRYRGKFDRKSKLFGPFGYVQGSSLTANETIKIIMDFVSKVFKIRSCKDTKLKVHQSMNKPCLEYQIGTCSAPCAGKISKEDYKNSINEASKFLNGSYSTIRKNIVEKINTFAKNNQFAEAGFLKNQLTAIDSLKNRNIEVNFDAYENLDVIAINENSTAVEVFAIRNGYALGGNLFELNTLQEDKTPSEILEAFLYEYYSVENLPPAKMFVNHAVETANTQLVFEELLGVAPVISSPKNEKDRALVKFVEANLIFQSGVSAKQQNIFAEGMQLLAQELNLQAVPQRVEIYDNSHTSGAFFMGAFIVASPSGFETSQYRKFNAKFSKGGDDYAMMREVMLRRFQESLATLPMPDLLIIDGGIGQFNAVVRTLDSIGVAVPVIAIAKGEDRNAGNETFFTRQNTDGFKLQNKQALYFIENLRDEAHRFVITAQRNKREKL